MKFTQKWTAGLLAAATWCLLLPSARAQLNLPEPSPPAQIQQKIGFTDITVRYARPAVKGRTTFGDLVPYGKLWRTGASDATVITFSDSIQLAGHWVPKGAYSLFTIPQAQQWTVILNRYTEGHGTEGYDEKNDQLRFNVKPQTSPRYYESFTIELQELVQNKGQLWLNWANTAVSFAIESNANARILAQIQQRMSGNEEKSPGLYYQAALYFFDTQQNPQQALDWVSQAVALKPAFNYLHLQAKLYARVGNYKAAIEAARQSANVARQEKFTDYVELNNRLIAEWQKKP
ncbi:DUF2911 domain-containing protein [Larkinella insperata]|uniref:DUF2911 domain-containing protein n=1 Tax=Larkinella insperata TaxID=332158 RepID=A0ABW3QC33_9BACT